MMGFWTEWALQCYRAVMFPVHWCLGLEAYAEDLDYWCTCPGQDCEECLNQ